jgi:hypothetical protein
MCARAVDARATSSRGGRRSAVCAGEGAAGVATPHPATTNPVAAAASIRVACWRRTRDLSSLGAINRSARTERSNVRPPTTPIDQRTVGLTNGAVSHGFARATSSDQQAAISHFVRETRDSSSGLHAVSLPHLVALVRAGAKFRKRQTRRTTRLIRRRSASRVTLAAVRPVGVHNRLRHAGRACR